MNPRITRPRAAIAGGSAFVVAAAVAVSLTLTTGQRRPGQAGKPLNAQLSSSSCTGPAGAAYIATAGYQAFDAVDTNNCYEVQQYNVGDPPVPGTGTSTQLQLAPTRASRSTATRCTSPTRATTRSAVSSPRSTRRTT